MTKRIWIESTPADWFDVSANLRKLCKSEKKISGDSLELMLANRIDGLAANELEVEVLTAIKQGTKRFWI